MILDAKSPRQGLVLDVLTAIDPIHADTSICAFLPPGAVVPPSVMSVGWTTADTLPRQLRTTMRMEPEVLWVNIGLNHHCPDISLYAEILEMLLEVAQSGHLVLLSEDPYDVSFQATLRCLWENRPGMCRRFLQSFSQAQYLPAWFPKEYYDRLVRETFPRVWCRRLHELLPHLQSATQQELVRQLQTHYKWSYHEITDLLLKYPAAPSR